MKQKDFITGALVGGCLGGIVALFMAPKSGKDLCDDIVEGYECMNQKSQDYLDCIKEHGECFLNFLQGKEEPENHNMLLIGAATGAIIGIISGLLLAPQSGSVLREELGDKYDQIYKKAKGVVKDVNEGYENFEHKIDDWKDTFSTIVNKLSSIKRKGIKGMHINEVLDWANLGLRLYKQLQKGR